MTTYVLDGWSSWLDLLEHHARRETWAFTGWPDILEAIDEIRYSVLIDEHAAEMWARDTFVYILESYG
jgi:hypothetical protein